MSAGLPSNRYGLIEAPLPILRASFSILGSRILLNLRGVFQDMSHPQSTCSQSESLDVPEDQGREAITGGVDRSKT